MASEILPVPFHTMYQAIFPPHGRMFPVYRRLSRHLTKLQSLFLCNLLHVHGLAKTRAEIIDGRVFFECSTNFLQEAKQSLGWTYDEQIYHLRELHSKKIRLIEMCYPHKGARRHIWIDTEKVWDMIQPSQKRYSPIEYIGEERSDIISRRGVHNTLMSMGRWFPCYLDLGGKLPKLDTMFLLDLCNIFHQKSIGMPKGEFTSWRDPIQCKTCFLEETDASMGWTQKEQRRLFQALSKGPKRLLTVCRKGNPSTRHIQIDMLELCRLLGRKPQEYIYQNPI